MLCKKEVIQNHRTFGILRSEALGVRRYRTHAMDQDRVDASCKGGGLIVFVEFEALNGIVGLVGFMVVYRVWGL